MERSRKPHSPVGEPENVLLGLLKQKCMHGYELHKSLNALAASGSVWRIKQANLYALLDRLEQDGLISGEIVSEETGLPRKVYALTERGAEVFYRWISDPVLRPRDLRWDFLMRLYFARLEGQAAAQTLLQRQREAILDWKQDLDAARTAAENTDSYQQVVLAYRCSQTQAALDWLSWCESSEFMIVDLPPGSKYDG
jgi:PadR family transcriptional regulator AphA